LKPFSPDLYSQDDLLKIEQYYKEHSTIGFKQETKFTQTYQQPATTNTAGIPQRCYVAGTDQITYQSNQCGLTCVCKPGYGGDFCQRHVSYATFTYTPHAVDKQFSNDEISTALLFDKFTEEIALSMTQFSKSDLFIVKHDAHAGSITVGIYSGLDYFIRNAELNTQKDSQQQQQPFELTSTSQSMFQVLASYFNPQATPVTPTTALPTQLDGLYNQWNGLQGSFPTTPIKNQETNAYLGPINPPSSIQDPGCVDQGILGCSGEEPKRVSSTALIVGLVVGLVLGFLIFIVLVCILLWCRRNSRGFWKSPEEQDRDEMSSFVAAPKKEFTGSTAAPKSTVGTSSIIPLAAMDITSTSGPGTPRGSSNNNTATSVQSVNNHKEVEDPTLPANIKAYKDAKGQIFYVDSNTMTTSWNHPNAAKGEEEGGYGSGW